MFALLAGCPANDPKPKAPSGTASTSSTKSANAAAKPLAPLERVAPTVDGGATGDSMYDVAPFTPAGLALPEQAVRVELDGEHAKREGQPWSPASVAKDTVVLLVPVGDTYLAQVAALLAALDDAGAKVWVKHPDAPLAFPVMLRDEPSFQAWLDEPVPGKLRIVHREDGFELQTNMGKLAGPDPNGPTVPVRGGKMDLKTLQAGLARIKGGFKNAPDYCVMPSFGMELAQTARMLAPNYFTAETPYFETTCLVYPRPRAPDAGPVEAPKK